MAVSLNSVVSFDFSAKCFLVSRSCNAPSSSRSTCFSSPTGIFGLRRSIKHKSRRGPCLLVADGDRVVADTSEVGPASPQTPDSPLQTTTSTASTQSKPDPSPANSKPGVKRSSLTAREKLRAARVLSRNTEPRAAKQQLGSRLLDALKESDRGKKSRLPEAPTNMLDDSKRGMPKKGLTFDFPGGRDVLIIAISFVTITTIMFGTTYFVWKIGAIHFNEG